MSTIIKNKILKTNLKNSLQKMHPLIIYIGVALPTAPSLACQAGPDADKHQHSDVA